MWLSYVDADWLADRHHLDAASRDSVEAICSGLDKLAGVATGRA